MKMDRSRSINSKWTLQREVRRSMIKRYLNRMKKNQFNELENDEIAKRLVSNTETVGL